MTREYRAKLTTLEAVGPLLSMRLLVLSVEFWTCIPISAGLELSLIHISEPTRLLSISYAVFCLKKKKKKKEKKKKKKKKKKKNKKKKKKKKKKKEKKKKNKQKKEKKKKKEKKRT